MPRHLISDAHPHLLGKEFDFSEQNPNLDAKIRFSEKGVSVELGEKMKSASPAEIMLFVKLFAVALAALLAPAVPVGSVPLEAVLIPLFTAILAQVGQMIAERADRNKSVKEAQEHEQEHVEQKELQHSLDLKLQHSTKV
eukprot:TRINITY_DN4970_c0_g1_i2.p1 TRINITY_DN4970_c0_g1~~TRINITY_DN4970_c0_g1_i2.p1  ORF type:complete len:140 (-),score=25.73 TRINITY_DN4970_c0_g1_i2:157-576(-)